ncbi:MAG: helix-turn-helix domain-containing protein [Polymorphobacter sp.]
MESVEFSARRTGATLMAARTAAGMELVDVARETRVPIRHLRALEADKHDDLPALPYAIGFVKSYARAVGLNSETMASQFRSETSKSAHVPTPISLEPLDERRVPSRGLWVGSLIAIIVIIAGLSAWGAGALDPPLPAAPEMTAAVIADTAEPDPFGPEPSGDIGVPVTAPAAATELAAVATGPVVLTASRDVWVKIWDKASGDTLKEGVLTAGEIVTIPSDRPGLTLWTGMAGALSVSVGGRPLPTLGGPVETVRDVSLLPADLLARSTPPTDSRAPAAATDRSIPAPIATPPIVAPRPLTGGSRPTAVIPGN